MASDVSGVVESLHRSDAHELSKGDVDRVELVAGLGITGDAHFGATVQHRSRVAADPQQPNLRQVHLMAAELHDELRSRGFSVDPGAMGENITTRGIELLELPAGAVLRLGDTALIAITGLRNPCRQLDRLQPELMSAVLDRTPGGALVRRAGVMGVVVVGGVVCRGDAIAASFPAGPATPLRPV